MTMPMPMPKLHRPGPLTPHEAAAVTREVLSRARAGLRAEPAAIRLANADCLTLPPRAPSRGLGPWMQGAMVTLCLAACTLGLVAHPIV